MYVVKESRDMTSFYRFNLFMIFSFKNDLLFIKILNIPKQIACDNKLINYRNLKRRLIVKNFLK